MYAGAIFIQQSLHVNLYLAIVGLLAVTALYTIAGMTGQGVMLGEVVGKSWVFSPLHLTSLFPLHKHKFAKLHFAKESTDSGHICPSLRVTRCVHKGLTDGDSSFCVQRATKSSSLEVMANICYPSTWTALDKEMQALYLPSRTACYHPFLLGFPWRL